MFAVGGPARGSEYLAGYVIGKSLSVDNVFASILSCFQSLISGVVGEVPVWVSHPFIAPVVGVPILASLWKTRGQGRGVVTGSRGLGELRNAREKGGNPRLR